MKHKHKRLWALFMAVLMLMSTMASGLVYASPVEDLPADSQAESTLPEDDAETPEVPEASSEEATEPSNETEVPTSAVTDEPSGETTAQEPSSATGEAEQPESTESLEIENVEGLENPDLSAAPANGDVDYVHIITDEYIEVGFTKNVTITGKEDFTVKIGDKEVDFSYQAYFNNMATLKLAEPLKDAENTSNLSVTVVDAAQTETATYEPFYTIKNQGTKSKIWVYGNDNSDTDATYGTARDAEYVIQYCAEGINKMVGRSDFLTLAASNSNLRVVVVGADQSVYSVPEYRHLYNADDAATRVTIPGTRELPLIVTTAEDVMRVKSANDNTFRMVYDFAKLFWELGVVDGWPDFALSLYDDEDTYNYVAHLEEAYNAAKAANLWPGTKMMESLEEYFAYATMVWYETLPESSNGTWQREAFPVNTRAELSEYDELLYGTLVEIYGEFEFFSGYREQNTSTKDSELAQNFPWYKHSQVDNYGIDGKAYAPLHVVETNLISANQIELVFNREIRDLDALRLDADWSIEWTDKDGNTTTYTKDQITRQFYQWKTLTLQVRGAKWYDGFIGTDVKGFTEAEVAPENRANKPWFDNGYARSSNPTRDGKIAVGPETYAKYKDTDSRLVEADPITVTASPSALEKGAYVSVNEGTLAGSINGSLKVSVGGDDVKDWADNALGAKTYNVVFKPWLGQVMRSPIGGVYVYGDNFVKKSSLEVACNYIDMILSNPTDQLGQRLCDGLVYAGGGLEIMSYKHHAYMMPGKRNTYGAQNHHYLYVEGFGGGVAQTTEFNVLRDYTFTRYDNEFILGHEFGHSIDLTGMPYFTDLSYELLETYRQQVTEKDLWNNGGASYAGSNKEEYFASLSNIWHGTMRESTDGSNNGTWLSINTREELYRYDRGGYDFMKKVYYNPEKGTGLTGTLEDGRDLAHPDYADDEIIKWGCTFPATLLNDDTHTYKWISWSTANQWDVNDDHTPGSGIRYGEHPNAMKGYTINYHPYLKFSSEEPTTIGAMDIVLTSEDKMVEGLTFKVVGKDFEQTYETDKDGKIYVKGLAAGEYTVSEVANEKSARYALPASQTVTVKDGETVSVAFENKLLRGGFKLVLVDGNGKAISGAKFELYTAGGDLLKQFTVGKDGIYTIADLLYGDYYLKEVEAAGYSFNKDKTYSFSVKENGTITEIKVVNQVIGGGTTNKPGTSGTPKTGDTSNLAMWLVLLGVCAAGAGGTYYVKKRTAKK
ncbi:SpaA isopeptide-forming pilin-related protein [Hominifimenecus sp. rT4P-3]|uniref:SpaA isopeptide-forming pilin-related protein n=1 Tax=Hominifimenecus sp. rT4P-3 TaxID=3242979 RepID=UPI003DA439A7